MESRGYNSEAGVVGRILVSVVGDEAALPKDGLRRPVGEIRGVDAPDRLHLLITESGATAIDSHSSHRPARFVLGIDVAQPDQVSDFVYVEHVFVGGIERLASLEVTVVEQGMGTTAEGAPLRIYCQPRARGWEGQRR